jgi:hypothetical protein
MSCLCSQHEWSFDSTVNIIYRITMIISGVIVVWRIFSQSQLQSACPLDTTTQITPANPDEVLAQQVHYCPIAAAVHESISAIYELMEKTSGEKEKEKEKERVAPVQVAAGATVGANGGSEGVSSMENSSMRCGRARSELRQAFEEPGVRIRSRSTESREDEDVRRCRKSWLKQRPTMKARC